MFEFFLSRISCFAPVRYMLHSEDSIVDNKEAYACLLKLEHLATGYFSTSESHHDLLERQLTTFSEISSSPGFWPYFSNQNRSACLPLHRMFDQFVRQGIPPRYRCRIWKAMCRPKSLVTYKSSITPYEKPIFQGIYDPDFKDRLSRVVNALYSRKEKIEHFESVCNLAGVLVLFMEESSAFNALNHLLDDLLSSFYAPKYLNDIGVILDLVVFEWLLSEQLPELCRHFRNIQLSLRDLIAPWFYSLFITHMPAETAFWLWDNVLLDGIVVVHEVGLAILRALKSDLLQLDNTISIIERTRKFTSALRDPDRLREHWQKLNKKHTMQARDRIAAKLEEEKKNGALKKCNELEMVTNFKGNQVRDLWVQYILVDPFLHYGTKGFDFEQFSQLIGGTFSGWSPCSDIVERMFVLADTKKDGIVCFQELFILFSVMCRGSFAEQVQFNFKLFDVAAKGWLDKFDLYRMLQSIYSIFEKDSEYRNMLGFFVESIYNNCVKTPPGVIYVDSFEYVVAVQPQIMERFLTRNPKLKGSLKNTFYYWGLDCDRPNKNREMISLELDRKAPIKQGQVTVPFVD